tara:strand:- start:2235 stop:2549 length:315 start_codon:yes stop_codon:yes gene_type:complete
MASVIRGSDNFDSSSLIGVGQTWEAVTGSRSLGTTYTNSTGKPIHVLVTITAGGGISDLTVGGVLIAKFETQSTVYTQCGFIVPDGVTYVISSNEVLILWAELR